MYVAAAAACLLLPAQYYQLAVPPVCLQTGPKQPEYSAKTPYGTCSSPCESLKLRNSSTALEPGLAPLLEMVVQEGLGPTVPHIPCLSSCITF